MATNKLQAAALALSGLFGVVVGVLLVTVARPTLQEHSAAASPSLVSDPMGDASTLETLTAIKGELQAIHELQRLTQQAALAAGGTRRPIEGERNLDSDELQAALLAAVSELQAAAQRFSNSQALVMPTQSATSSLPNPADDRFEDLVHENLLLDFQGILDLYGKPERVTVSGGVMRWVYPLEDGDSVSFLFSNGLVYRVDN